MSLNRLDLNSEINAKNYRYIQDAFDDADGRTLRIPAGDYVHDSAVEGLLWTKPARVVGAGMHKTRILISSNLPTDKDALTIAPDASVTGENLFGWSFEGVRVKRQSGTPGRHGMVIAVPDTATAFLAKFAMRDAWIGPFEQRAFSFTKGTDGGTPTNKNGLFTLDLSDSRFDGGASADHVVHLDNSGDSFITNRNTATGTGIGIYTRPVSGAAQQVFADWNITATGGALYVKGGTQIRVRGGQWEQSGDYTGADDAQVVLDGSTECEISGVNLNGYARVSNIKYKGGASRNRVHGCTMFSPAGKFHFVFASDAEVRNDIGRLRNSYLLHDGTNASLEAQPRVSDLTSPVKVQTGVYQAQTLQNSWAAASTGGSFDEGLWAAVLPDGEVVFKGWIAGGTNTAGTTIATLPAQMRPLLKAKRINVMTLNGAAWEAWPLQILTTGAINIPSQVLPATTLVGFDNARFNIY